MAYGNVLPNGMHYGFGAGFLLPGGGEIDLTPAAGALLAAHVKAQVGNDPHTFEQAYRKALSSLGNDYWGKVASPPDAALAQAAAIAAPEGSG